VHWNGAVGEQVELGVQHPGGKPSHDRFGLDMEVPEHFIGAPATDESDNVSVDLGAKEGHCASRTEGAGTDIVMEETELGGIASSNSGAKSISNLGWADTMPTAGEVVGGNGSCWRGGVVAKVMNSALKGLDGAEVVLSAAKANDFATNAIFLAGEFKSAKSGGKEQCIGARGKVDALGSNKKLNITKGEGRGVGRSTGVLARAEEEEEGDDDHVRYGCHHRILEVAGVLNQQTENLDWDRFNPCGRGVGSFPRFPEAGKAEINLAEDV
jgi:hypothetical protein